VTLRSQIHLRLLLTLHDLGPATIDQLVSHRRWACYGEHEARRTIALALSDCRQAVYGPDPHGRYALDQQVAADLVNAQSRRPA
jgi:hypothetical protein